MQTCTDRLADPNSDLQYRPVNPYFDGHKTEIGSELLQTIFKLPLYRFMSFGYSLTYSIAIPHFLTN